MLIFPGRGGGWLITGIIKALLNKDKLIDVLIKILMLERGLQSHVFLCLQVDEPVAWKEGVL